MDNYKEVVRVATNNNFNCTEAEWTQLKFFAKKYPDKYFFVNSNINTPNLPNITDHNHKAVITLNPDLHCNVLEVLSKLMTVPRHFIAFARIKYIPHDSDITELIKATIQYGLPIVITLQRYNGKATLLKYGKLEDYEFSCSRYRLQGPELDKITSLVQTLKDTLDYPIYICDQAGTGCQGCGLCSRLTTNENLSISSLNLSSSGLCPYNCPDCYAKTMSHFAEAMGNKPTLFDVIKKNSKQAGTTKHIKEARAK